jgi:tetratricopeptide (TPR) repeat protein
MADILGIACIVKNESEKVKETLSPFITFGITNILVLDTGSIDDTCEKVKSLSDKITIGHAEFNGFDKSRNLALDMARDSFDESVKFILMIDIEWYAEYINDLVKFCDLSKNTDCDIFYISLLLEGHTLNKKACLFRRHGTGFYKNVLHEYAVGKEGKCVPKFHMKVIHSEIGLEKTKTRNIEFDIPFYFSKGDDIEYCDLFHLAQAYHNIKNHEKAIEAYQKVYENEKALDTFKYVSAYRIGEIAIVENNIFLAVIGYTLAYTIAPWRCESIFRLSQINVGLTKYKLIKECCTIKIPTDISEIFSLTEIYNVSRYYELANACFIVGKYKEGKEAIKRVLYKITSIHPLFKLAKDLEIKLSKNIVILILTSPDYEDYNAIMETYLNNFGFEFYFYQFSDRYDKITTVGHQIYIPGVETMVPGILDKTIKVFKMFSTYDYIIRLNATSILNLTKVKFDGDYWGYYNSVKLEVNDEYGITEEFLKRIVELEFVSGKCICLSKAAITILLNSEIDMTIMDDIAIALAMKPHYSINLNSSFSKDIDCIEATLISCSDTETMEFVINELVK